METAQALQGIAGMLYLVTLAVVGVKLMLLWRRTREKPELMLAGSLILGGVFGAMLEASGIATRGAIAPTTSGILLLSGKCFGVFGLLLQGLFIRLVFRNREVWATGLVSLCIALAVTSILGFWLSGTYSTGALPTSWVLIEFCARITGPTWLVIESGRYAIAMRKRLRFGLGDPLVANRFLLWSLSGVFGLFILASSLPPIFLDVQKWETLLQWNLVLFSVGGMGSAVFYWLTFFPPTFYARWIRTKATPQA